MAPTKSDPSPLALSPREVAVLNPTERRDRLCSLMAESLSFLDRAIDEFVVGAGKELAGICAMFSGGKDSTVLTHLFRSRVTHAIHANTTIGIEETRRFVREVSRQWELNLLEYEPNQADRYRTLVLEHGFPGPGMHMKMYQRLKERAFHKARRELARIKSVLRETQRAAANA